MAALPDSAREVIESPGLAHLVTLNEDGSPQVTCVWIGLDGEQIVSGSLDPRRKLDNIRRDPRVAITIETEDKDDYDLRHYLVIYGTAEVTEGGAPELLQELAYTYIAPGVKFPPMPDPPPGYVTRITIDRIAGNGPWAS